VKKDFNPVELAFSTGLDSVSRLLDFVSRLLVLISTELKITLHIKLSVFQLFNRNNAGMYAKNILFL